MQTCAQGVWVRAALVCAVLLAMALVPLRGQAQTFRGTILGTVTDQTGAVVPGAKVTVRNVDTGLARETETAGDGSYAVPELPIGTYTVTVEKAGFQASVTTGVRVEVAAERRVDASLRPGDVVQRIEVSAETLPLVETTANVQGGAFESKQVLDLPINGRDFTRLLIMVPGAAGEPNGGGDSPGSFGLFSINGNRGRSNNFLLDGTDMNDGYRNLPAINQGGVFGTPGTVLPIEAIAETRILSNFEAEYGRNSGGVVNIVTKSGTNDLHGSVFDYFRNDVLNARNFFNVERDPSGNPLPKDRFRNNQFGASAGGPLIQDRTFWYFAYEGQRERVGVASLNTVPSSADYAAAILSLGGNPATPIASNPVVNPVVQNLFKLCATKGGCSGGKDVWPASNLSGTPKSVSSAPASNDADSLIAKIDHSFNEHNQLSGRYFYGSSNQSFPLGLAGGNNLPNTNTFSPIRAQLVSLSYVHVHSANQVNEARFGWNRYRNGFFAADREVFGNPKETFGLNTGVTAARDFGLPQIAVNGFAALGSSGFSNPRDRVDSNWQFIDNYSWKLSRHDVKFGYEFRRTSVDSINDFHFRGKISFDSLADFLDGKLSSSGKRKVAGNTAREARQNFHALYVQDSIRWQPNFTVNLGLRWDYFGVLRETKNRFSIYDPARGLVQVSRLYERDLNNFSPRVSFAWDVGSRGKTVVRGGFGVFYDAFSQDFFTGQIFLNSFNAGPAYNAIGSDPIFISFTFNPALCAAFDEAGECTSFVLQPGISVFDPATLRPFSLTPPIGSPTDTIDAATVERNLRTPYVYNYNLNIQQELFRNTVLQVGYVGSGGRKLFRFRDINQSTPTDIDAYDPVANQSNCCASRPFDTKAVLSSLARNTPFYVNQLETSSVSNYNSLQVAFTQRSWRGWTHQLAWTWSHSIDNASDGQDYVPNAAQPDDSHNAHRERGNSNFDARHRFVWSLNYEFPKWEALSRLGEGWQISGVLTFMSGHPFHINYNFIDDFSGSGQFFDRPDLVGTVRYNRSNPLQFLDLSSFRVPCVLNPDGLCIRGTRHFGSLGRNALLGPDYRNFDFAIIKVTPLTERFKLQFRADFFNLTNHPNFANPYLPAFIADAAPNGFDSSGQHLGFLPIVATSDIGLGNPILGGGGPRSVQFALKLLF